MKYQVGGEKTPLRTVYDFSPLISIRSDSAPSPLSIRTRPAPAGSKQKPLYISLCSVV